jgi:CDK-activating kinase assembly factor MAT1
MLPQDVRHQSMPHFFPRHTLKPVSSLNPRCESCIDRIYTLGPEPCPTCGLILRKNNFAPQTFENLAVEKEVKIRSRIAK